MGLLAKQSMANHTSLTVDEGVSRRKVNYSVHFKQGFSKFTLLFASNLHAVVYSYIDLCKALCKLNIH
jgi:hypothetical protein